jgi:hypothetical protein
LRPLGFSGFSAAGLVRLPLIYYPPSMHTLKTESNPFGAHAGLGMHVGSHMNWVYGCAWTKCCSFTHAWHRRSCCLKLGKKGMAQWKSEIYCSCCSSYVTCVLASGTILDELFPFSPRWLGVLLIQYMQVRILILYFLWKS